jgi:hypothetical protein
MSLHYRVFGLACDLCGRPVQRLDVYDIGVSTVHEPGYGPPCDVVHIDQLRPGGAVEFLRPLASPGSSAQCSRGAA